MQSSIKISKPIDVITVESIYELASEIGEHFKKLIHLFGAETFEALIPCVVRVLENLEDVTIQRNNCLDLVDKLYKQIEELQKEHKKRIKDQLKYQSEIEDIDELWRKENGKLEQYIKYLKNENNRLSLLRKNEKFSHSLIDLKPEETIEKSSHQRDVINAQIDKLKTKLRILNNEIELKDEEISNLKTENDNINQENKNLRKIVSLSLNTIFDSEADQNVHSNNESILKNKIKILEEKLDLYKSQLESYKNEKNIEDVPLEPIIISNNDNSNDEKFTEQKSFIKMEDLPVQGPIPKEPDEKIYWPNNCNRNRGRIWSFFPRFTKAFIK